MWFSGPKCLCLENGGTISYLDLISKSRRWICYALLSARWELGVQAFLLSCYNIEKVVSNYSCYAATVIRRGTFLTHRDATTWLHQIEGEPCKVAMALQITQAISRRLFFFFKTRTKDSDPVFIITFTGHLKCNDVSSSEMISCVTSISKESLL